MQNLVQPPPPTVPAPTLDLAATADFIGESWQLARKIWRNIRKDENSDSKEAMQEGEGGYNDAIEETRGDACKC